MTGDTNFAMPFTRLTVGGFTQPGVARSLIELPSNAEKGLSHRFLWLFPSPLFGKFSSLKEVDKSFQRDIGKSNCFIHEMCSMSFYFCVYIRVAKLLADQWKSCPSTQTSLPVKIFRIARDSTAFGEYYDHVQEGLRTLAGMDELMAGKCMYKLCKYMYTCILSYYTFTSLDTLVGSSIVT